MRFLGSNFTQRPGLRSGRGSPPDPAGGAKALPQTLADLRGPLRGRGKGKEGKMKEGKGKGVLGKEKREGREGNW